MVKINKTTCLFLTIPSCLIILISLCSIIFNNFVALPNINKKIIEKYIQIQLKFQIQNTNLIQNKQQRALQSQLKYINIANQLLQQADQGNIILNPNYKQLSDIENNQINKSSNNLIRWFQTEQQLSTNQMTSQGKYQSSIQLFEQIQFFYKAISKSSNYAIQNIPKAQINSAGFIYQDQFSLFFPSYQQKQQFDINIPFLQESLLKISPQNQNQLLIQNLATIDQNYFDSAREAQFYFILNETSQQIESGFFQKIKLKYNFQQDFVLFNQFTFNNLLGAHKNSIIFNKSLDLNQYLKFYDLLAINQHKIKKYYSIQNKGSNNNDYYDLEQTANKVFGQNYQNEYQKFLQLLNNVNYFNQNSFYYILKKENNQNFIIFAQPIMISNYLQFIEIYIYDQEAALLPFKSTFQKLQYIKYITFGVILLISLFMIFLVNRYSLILSTVLEDQWTSLVNYIYLQQETLDQNPINDLNEYLETSFQCEESRYFYDIIIKIVNNFKLSNKIFTGKDQSALIELSNAKMFYQNYKDLQGIGICCNNIGNIHLMHGRYYESVAEYQEAILMAKILIENLKDLKSKKPKKSKSSLGQKTLKQLQQYANNDQPASLILNDKPPENIEQQQQQQQNIIPFQEQNEKLSPQMKKINEQVQEQNNENFIHYEKKDELFNQQKQKKINQIISLESNKELLLQDGSELEQIISSAIITLMNRKYQLGNVLFLYSATQEEFFYSQAIRLFEQCQSLTKDTEVDQIRSNMSRQIIIYCKKIYCLLRIGEFDLASIETKIAINLLTQLEEFLQQNQNIDNSVSISLFLDIFKAIPLEVLRCNINILNALQLIPKFQFLELAKQLSNALIFGDTYDPLLRYQCLTILQNTFKYCFEKNVQQNKQVQNHLQKFKLNKINSIIMIDYSKDMSSFQIQLSHKLAKIIFEFIRDEDNIGLLFFNTMIHQCFSLQQKKLYKDLLQKKVRTPFQDPGGECKLFYALSETINQFKKVNLKSQNNKDQQIYNKNIIFLFTEGGSTLTNEEYKQIQKNLDENVICLIICNISNQNANMIYLSTLSQITNITKSAFLNSEQELKQYFMAEIEQIFINELIIEYF